MHRYKNKTLISIIVIAVWGAIFSHYRAEDSPKEENSNIAFTDDMQMKVHFIDVGQGDSALLELPGEKTMLIDAGDNGSEGVILGYIDSLDIDRIDYLIATHPHADHIGGMEEIIKSYDIGAMYMPRVSSESRTFEKMLDAIEEKDVPLYTLESGKSIDTEGVAIDVLSPPENLFEDKNNNSAIVKITLGEKSFLFMGDAESQAEEELLKNVQDISCDVLKVGHHGSSTSSGKRFLEAAMPKYAVISCGKDNSYGHPHRETIESLQKNGSEVFRTDELGTIIIKTDGKDIAVER